MNLYKFTFDLKGSSNLMLTVTIPTDSKYSVGIKICDGENEVVLDDTMKLTIQDDKYIYTPTEIFNNYAVFACKTDSEKGTTKTYQVNFHKDGKESEVAYDSGVKTPTGARPMPIGIQLTISLQDIINYMGDDMANLAKAPEFFKLAYSIADTQDEVKIDKKTARNALELGWKLILNESGKVGERIPGTKVASRYSSDYMTLSYAKLGNKVGWVLYNWTKAADEFVISEDMFVEGKISDLPAAFTHNELNRIYLILSLRTPDAAMIPIGKWGEMMYLAGDDIPEFNLIFRGFNVKTNDSKIANWAITDSQMKIVYTNEWPELSATADDRLIYFVVDKPTPPKPVPPKPVPPTPGSDVFVIGFLALSESDEFDSNSVEDCLTKLAESSIKYTRDNDDYYVTIQCTSTGNETQGEAAKVDLIRVPLGLSTEDDGKTYIEIDYAKITNNSFILGSFGKEVASVEEALELINLYNVDRFGEDFSLPNISNPIPEDINDWKIVYEETMPVEGIVITNDYVYIPGNEETETPPMKYLLNSETFPQWTEVDPG